MLGWPPGSCRHTLTAGRCLDDALAASGFPFLRVTAHRQYSQQQVIDQLNPYLGKPKPSQQEEGVTEPVIRWKYWLRSKSVQY
jgi:hypothetical protein